MSALAVLLDETVRRGGEMQIKRTKARGGFGSAWELTIWTPVQGSTFPTREVCLQASTPLDLLRQLDAYIEKREQPQEQRMLSGVLDLQGSPV